MVGGQYSLLHGPESLVKAPDYSAALINLLWADLIIQLAYFHFPSKRAKASNIFSFFPSDIQACESSSLSGNFNWIHPPARFFPKRVFLENLRQMKWKNNQGGTQEMSLHSYPRSPYSWRSSMQMFNMPLKLEIHSAEASWRDWEFLASTLHCRVCTYFGANWFKISLRSLDRLSSFRWLCQVFLLT